MACRARRGVSPIIATLLLVVIAVAGAVVTYAFVSGFMGTTPEAPKPSISVDNVSGNSTHVFIYVRNTGAGQALIDQVYVERGGSLVAHEDVDKVIPPGNVGVVTMSRGSLGSDIAYTFKVVCTGNTMHAVYSSSIGSGGGGTSTDTTPPAYSSIGANTTIAGTQCLFSSTWSDNAGLSGFIFSTNLTGSWTNSSWATFTGNVANEVMSLPSSTGVIVGYGFYANDTSNNWAMTGTHFLTTGQYVWVPENTTVVTGYTSPALAPSGTWADTSYAYSDGTNYASTTSNAIQQFSGYGFSLPDNTTSIDSIVIRYDAWASVIPSYTEMYSSFIPAGTGWQNYDIYTNLGVPKGAIAEIIMLNGNDAAARTLGVRTDGSSLSRYIKLHEAEAGGNVTANMLVKVDPSTGYIETYCDSTTGVIFICLGYWEGVDFTELMYTWTAGTASAWTDYDLSARSVPAGSVSQFYVGNRNNGAATTAGVRYPTTGTMNRYMSIHEAESASTEYTDYEGYTTFVKSNSTGYIQYYGSSTSYADFILLGYFGSSMDYQELWTRKDQASTGWVDWDLTANLDKDGRVVNFVLGHNVTGTEHTVGARTDNSALNRVVLTHESESNLYASSSMTVKSSDAAGIVELYTSTTSEYFWLAGYFKPPPSLKIQVDASYDGGSNWVTAQEKILTTSETTYTYDITSLRSWSYSDLSDSNFRVRVTSVVYGSNEIRLDWIPVNVTYTYDSSHWEYIT